MRIRQRLLLSCAIFAAISATGPSPARAHGAGADHGGNTQVVDDASRCDLGFNTKAYNDLIRQGGQPATTQPGFRRTFMRPLTLWETLGLSGQALRRSIWGWTASQMMWDGRVVAGHAGHPLADPWQPLTDPVACNQLKSQLQATRDYVQRYPTLGDAVKAGYTFVTPWFAGSGAHLGRWQDLDDKVEMGKPEVLIYDGNEPGSHVVGGMYAVLRDSAPNGIFAGGNDSWHRHKGLCWTSNQAVIKALGFVPATKIVLGSESSTPAYCQMLGGRIEPFESLYMLHAWVVPGCASDLGVFSHDLPYLTFRNHVLKGPGARNAGCGSGLKPTDPLTAFETDELDIPGQLSTYRSSALTWTGAGQPASGPVAALVDDHPGAAHANGETHLAGHLLTEDGFSGPPGAWPISILRGADGTVHGTLATPTGATATFAEAAAVATAGGVRLTAEAATTGGARVELTIEFADPALRSFFLGASAIDAETLVIRHPAHGHAHAAGPVSYELAEHPGANHVGTEHLFGTAATKDGFSGDAGVWTVSFSKETATQVITGYLTNPPGSGVAKTFHFTVSGQHPSDECAGGVHLVATGSESATPTDPQNPEFAICDAAAAAFFDGHDSAPTTSTPPSGEHEH